MNDTKNTELHVVQAKPNPRPNLHPVRQSLEEPDLMLELEEKIQRHKKQFWQHTIVGTVAIILVVVGTYLMVELQTYNTVRVLSTFEEKGMSNSGYVEFANGIMKYSRDGVSLKNDKGKEMWNQPCQIKNPMVNIYEDSAVVADKGGNDMLVFDKKGLKGEIHTTLPIEKVVVSGQGIVSAVLKDGPTPHVMCYDAAGNLLAEQKASISGTGYPVDIAISENGCLLLVSYLRVQGGVVTTKIVYYNLQNSEKKKTTSHQAVGKDYQNEIMPSVFFMDAQTSVVVGNSSLIIYKGESDPKVASELKINKEIKSVFHNNHYIGLILKNQGQVGNELRLYNKEGKVVLTKNVSGEYANIKIAGRRIIMYDGKKCCIYKKSGVLEFKGELDVDALEITPIAGVNKYIVMSASGMEQIRFVK
ncbi:MAG: DUF5711 family protein [Lachnospiraceae bacterium]